MPDDFKVKVGEFEGPMELLLNLIEEKKLHISQVSLATVADGFIDHLRLVDGENKKEMADFVLVASTLMLIKSLSLLPSLATTPEEEESMADLERRLRLYQRTRELAEQVKARFGAQVIFAREPAKTITPVFAPTHEMTLSNLVVVLKNLIQNFPKLEKLPEVVVKKVLSLEEAITDLTKRVQSALKMSFSSFVKDKADKVNIIVIFLGMLELVKQGIVAVEQQTHFADINLESAETGVPKYL